MREVFKTGERREAAAVSWETLGVVALVAGALVMCFLALTRDTTAQVRAADRGAVTAAGGAVDPTDSEPPAPGTSAPDGDSESGTADPDVDATDRPPAVEDARRVDFTTTDRLPDGSRTFDNESVGSPIAVEDGGLQHGSPRGPVAVSSLETRLGSDVRKIGARVRFVGDDPGSVVLVAWQSSFVESRLQRTPVPSSGLRLVASAGSWSLTTTPGDEVLADGEFTRVQGTATFEVYRQAGRAWVVDPAGGVTQVQDTRIAELAGPFACWQLVEREVSMAPAVIESVWAG